MYYKSYALVFPNVSLNSEYENKNAEYWTSTITITQNIKSTLSTTSMVWKDVNRHLTWVHEELHQIYMIVNITGREQPTIKEHQII